MRKLILFIYIVILIIGCNGKNENMSHKSKSTTNDKSMEQSVQKEQINLPVGWENWKTITMEHWNGWSQDMKGSILDIELTSNNVIVTVEGYEIDTFQVKGIAMDIHNRYKREFGHEKQIQIKRNGNIILKYP